MRSDVDTVMSPPALMHQSVHPCSARIRPARSADHPLTYAEGSKPPSRYASNAPPESAATASHAAITSRRSVEISCTSSSPRPKRETSLSS